MRYELFLLASHSLGRAFTGTGISLGPLPIHRETFPMPKSAITSQVHETLDVHGDLTTKVTLNFDILVDGFTNPGDFRFREILSTRVEINACFGQNGL